VSCPSCFALMFGADLLELLDRLRRG
jgi:hypothetical protein